MRLRDIPADIAVSISFAAVFLLAFIPSTISMFAPDLVLAIKAMHEQGKARAKAP
jgi:hypothetical protein